ncbi:MAG: flagellar motor protein MotA [Opitutae bacterium]|jgi:biopolymer transport protein TolQ|nr:flagellar motor protein MotA [Opitutae bacterium]|tara:strand:- start:855 stop:1562 length:708 start_codon:yes stop_codon:yes gene_type:complete
MMMGMEFPAVLAEGIFDYFAASNLAGQIIVLVLAGLSMWAWTIIASKIGELKKLHRANEVHAGKFRALANVLEPPPDFFKGAGSPVLQLYARGVEAFRKLGNSSPLSEEEQARQRMGHVENALRRKVSALTDVYEEKMIFLASIVSGAPFLGLLGTTWGVMDSFGAIAYAEGSPSIKDLGPGVSGALLTTVAGLLVAIPSVFLYNYLLRKTRQEITKLENYASEVADRIELDANA